MMTSDDCETELATKLRARRPSVPATSADLHPQQAGERR
jgi:hypothetical protein